MNYRQLFWRIFKAAFAGAAPTGCFRVPISQYHLQTLTKIYNQWKENNENNA